MSVVLALFIAASTETYQFTAWGQDITVRIVSIEAVRRWCVGALGLPPNTIGCSYWLKGDKTRCIITLPHIAPTWLVFHELLDRCRDRNTKPFLPRRSERRRGLSYSARWADL